MGRKKVLGPAPESREPLVSDNLAAPGEAPDLERAFTRLADDWRQATAMLSSTSGRIAHPAYQQIICMGWPAVPLLLKELERAPEHWFHALSAITEVNPVSDVDRGNVRKMADAWVMWGRSQGYI